MKPKNIFIILLAIVIGIIFIISVCFFGYIALGFYAVSGKHTPAISDNFFFYKTGVIREFQFTPKLFKDYNVRIVSSEPFPTKEEFDWIVKYEIVDDGKIVQEGYLKEQTRLYADNYYEYETYMSKAIDFKSFGILRKWFGKPITIRLIVEKGASSSKKYEDVFKTMVDISWYK